MEGWGWIRDNPYSWNGPIAVNNLAEFQGGFKNLSHNSGLAGWVAVMGQRDKRYPTSNAIGWMLWSAFCIQWIAVGAAALFGRP